MTQGTAMTPEWAVFHGSAEEHEDRCILVGVGENGRITVPRESVSFAHNKISLRVGTVGSIVHEPTATEHIAGYAINDGCTRTCSIGLVEICCDDGRILGPCRLVASS